jgi:hypothetical protein
MASATQKTYLLLSFSNASVLRLTNICSFFDFALLLFYFLHVDFTVYIMFEFPADNNRVVDLNNVGTK